MISIDDKKTQVKASISMHQHMIIALSEFFGTAMLLFLTCTGCTMFIQGRISSMHTSFCAGLSVTAVIQMFGHISAAHVNPVVTLAAFILDEITAVQVPIYIVSQILGCLAGYGFQRAVTPDLPVGVKLERGICVNAPHDSLTDLEALGVETLLTIVLVIANCAAWDNKNSDKLDSVPLKIGIVVVVLNLAASAYTGASMNPVRSFGPAFWNNDYSSHWVYWVGPTIGSVLATTAYKYIFAKRR